MPDPTTTGYVLVSIAANDDDTPAVPPEQIADQIVTAGIEHVVEARCLFLCDDGSYRGYGPSYVAF